MSIYHHADENMIAELSVNNLRCFESISYQLHPKLNLFYGNNGAGKTSVLEAIYMLSSGHSFRTRETRSLINREQDRVTVFCRLQSGDSIGLEKSRQAKTRVKVNGNYCASSSQLAEMLAVQVIYQNIFQIIDAGPAVRRTILDWGLFHVKQNYFEHWKNYQRALRQRNALLRQRVSTQQIQVWDKPLAQYGESLHQMRFEYFDQLKQSFIEILPQLLSLDADIEYYCGWRNKGDTCLLSHCISANFENDCLRQYTQLGPHQADIKIQLKGRLAKNVVSRGQQKMLLIALKLAQLKLVNKPVMILIDDFNSELDKQACQRLADYLLKLDNQLIITTIDKECLTYFTNHPHKMFHVKPE